MSKRASERRKHELGEVTLNLNPMMDMFAVLIPALLMMSVVVEVSAVNVAAPSLGGADDASKAPDTPPLTFTVTINDSGYQLSTSAGPLAAIPIVEKSTGCSRYRGTVPPPRSKNADRAPCDPKKPEESRSFWVYDTRELHRAAVELKDAHPDERRVILSAASSIDFEPLADAMDATRDTMSDKQEVRPLFDEVVISPAPN